ncbi:MAG: hypothetical protein ACQETB_13600 [Halobacteriota archaeon]
MVEEPYLSHPVRRLREDPIDGESVALVVELGALDSDRFAEQVQALDGAVERKLVFDAYLLELPQTALDSLCSLDGIVRIETAATIATTPDIDTSEEGDDATDRNDDRIGLDGDTENRGGSKDETDNRDDSNGENSVESADQATSEEP